MLNLSRRQKDIRHLDFDALKRAGYRGAVFDKDNCLVKFPAKTLTVNAHEQFTRLFPERIPSYRKLKRRGRSVNKFLVRAMFSSSVTLLEHMWMRVEFRCVICDIPKGNSLDLTFYAPRLSLFDTILESLSSSIRR